MERKTLDTAELVVKDAAKGEVVAEIGTPGTVDKDGDVFLAGSTQPPSGAKVKISGYSHDVVTDGAPPAGAGVVTEEGGKILLRGRFFMGTTRGRESFEVVKELGPDGQWSVGFPESSVAVAPLTTEWREKGARRLISAYTPVEASPVFMASQHGTRTLAVKRARDTEDAVRAAGLKTLKSIMAERELSHREVADAMEVDVPTLRQILTGKAPFPDLDGLKALEGSVQVKAPNLSESAVNGHIDRFRALYGDPEGVGVPEGVRNLAETAVSFAAKRWGVPEPRVVFFTRKSYGDGASGYFRASVPNAIHLRHDLDAGELFRVALHETCHYARHRLGLEWKDETTVDGDTRELFNLYRMETRHAWASKMASSAELSRYFGIPGGR